MESLIRTMSKVLLLLLSSFFSLQLCIAQESDLDLFMARGFAGGTDFERYNLKAENLWYECGELTDKAKPDFEPIIGDDMLEPNARLKVSQRYYVKLDPKRLADLIDLKREIESMDFGGKLVPPGAVFGLSGEGIIDLKIGNKRITTSVDELSGAKRKESRLVKELVEYLRGAGEEICAAKTFFGIGRR